MKPPRKTTLEERMEADPELRAAFEEDLDEWMIERIKSGHREQLARERQVRERVERLERRRARLRRLTFGLLGRHAA